MASEPPPPDPASVVLTFLESAGRRSDAEFYLRLFRRLPKESFAVLALEAAALRYALPSVVDQLRFLRDLGLFAPVVVGLFEPRSADRGASRLAEKCREMNAVVHDARDPDAVTAVAAELRREQLPIVNFAKYPSGESDERFRRVGDFVAGLRSGKLVVVRRRGGLALPVSLKESGARWQPSGKGKISMVNLTTDFDDLSNAGLSVEDLELLSELRGVLLRPDCRGAVASVTSPLNLLPELFTTKGAGTFVKRGSSIQRFDSYSDVDLPKLRALLEASFGRRLAPSFFERAPSAVYLEESYRGAAILTPTDIVPLLTKFAVDRVAQGEGMGRDLWQALTRRHPALFWRARVENPISAWYASLCDGMMRAGEWNVYFRGVTPDQVPAIIRHALSLPQDFS